MDLKPGKVVFDGTLGGAGHTVAIFKAIAPTGKIIAIDHDSQAVSTAAKIFEGKNNAYFFKGNFADILTFIKKAGIKKIDAFFLDLGMSSMQIEKSKRGFSYMRDELLDMRMDKESDLSAFEVINFYSEEKLRNIFYQYGEENYSARIASNIIKSRNEKEIRSTGELNAIIEKSIPPKARYGSRGHPSKRIFQAIRIEVNRELDNLASGIDNGFKALNKGGRMVIISYHSLEDRIVKKKFQALLGKCICPPDLPECVCGARKVAEILTKKVIIPGEE
ncbi:MAG: 16S rRNA (cytosine(1402)-N(4))-methyltransferase RsmH, partial [Actinomycetota bacterium]|nr:16S rRNA (cytosine(1402)-N(4))-methyltransferase RsmH [Actinomycetota bacterium]